METDALCHDNARLRAALAESREQLALVVEECEVEAARALAASAECERLRAVVAEQAAQLATRAVGASDAHDRAAESRSSGALRERAEAAEAAVTELEARLAACEARAERDAVDARVALAAATRAAAAAHSSSARLRHDVEQAQARYEAQAGVVDMLRAQLADAHDAIAQSHARRSEAATRAARALRDVEGQVGALTAAVSTMRSHGTARD